MCIICLSVYPPIKLKGLLLSQVNAIHAFPPYFPKIHFKHYPPTYM